mmetsp:Transcript_10131/g.7599  ORF Transcript_10131/g.7599 Transcript_10131/m.7599 type:complete len:92 (+) Transcript_10131:235-510(+)
MNHFGIMIYCQKHKHKEVRFFCMNTKQFLCTDCLPLLEKHRDIYRCDPDQLVEWGKRFSEASQNQKVLFNIELEKLDKWYKEERSRIMKNF